MDMATEQRENKVHAKRAATVSCSFHSSVVHLHCTPLSGSQEASLKRWTARSFSTRVAQMTSFADNCPFKNWRRRLENRCSDELSCCSQGTNFASSRAPTAESGVKPSHPRSQKKVRDAMWAQTDVIAANEDGAKNIRLRNAAAK
jgi:hypothetical protein